MTYSTWLTCCLMSPQECTASVKTEEYLLICMTRLTEKGDYVYDNVKVDMR